LLALSIKAIKINMTMFPILGLQFVTVNFFQCIGKVKVSIFLSMTRQMLFLLPLLAILPTIFGFDGVWYSLPGADFSSTVVSACMLAYFIRKYKRQKGKITSKETNHEG
jgi:Na+-driven multidrug efflux pump